MKKQILLLPMLILALVFTGCSDDDPAPVEEQEVITTVVVTLTGTDGTGLCHALGGSRLCSWRNHARVLWSGIYS
jgi:hypothetical protein